MAERSQQSQIDQDVIPVKAEARALLIATVAVAFFPWVAILAGVALLIAGYDAAGYLSALAGVLSAGPQIIAATRRAGGGARKK